MSSKEIIEYRNIFKAISIFGGAQVIIILLGIIRTKVIAVSIGTEGIGLLGIYSNTITLFISFSSFGIGYSAVKLLSELYWEDKENYRIKLSVFNKLTTILGVFGVAFLCFLSPLLSMFTFNTYDFTIAFIILSIVVYFEAINTKYQAILQSTRELNILGKVSVFGAIIGTLLSIPLYVIYKSESIVYCFVILYFSNMVVGYYFTRKFKLNDTKIDIGKSGSIIKEFFRIGIAMTISTVLVYLVSYIIRVYIANKGSIGDVGLFQSGWMLATNYVGILFTAMAKDYYPRLASVNNNNKEVVIIANQQIELGLLIASPIILLFFLFVDQVIYILYSPEFIKIKYFLFWSFLGMFFKILSWSVSYIFLAKGLSKVFLVYEILGTLFTLVVSVLFYESYGLEGLGFAVLITNIFYLLLVYVYSIKCFAFRFSKGVVRIFLINLTIGMLCVVLLRFFQFIDYSYIYSIVFVAFLASVIYSMIQLNKKLGIITLVLQKIKDK